MANIQFKTILRQTAISAFLSFLTFAFSFVRVWYFSKHMSMEDFGILSLLLGYSAFLIYIFTLGSYQYLFKCVNEGEEAKRTGLAASLSLTAFISFIAIIIASIFCKQLCHFLNISNYQTDFELTIIGTAITSIMILLLYYHYGLGRNNFQNFLQFLRGSLWIIVSIVASLFCGLTLTKTLIVFNLSIFCILLLSIPWKDLPFLLSVPIRKITFRPLFNYCLPLLPYFAGVWGIPIIIRSQINIYNGPKSVALFNVAYTLMEIVFMFISTITATLSPYFFADSKEDNKKAIFYNIMLKYSIILIVLMLPFVYITRFDIILLLTSNKYIAAGNLIPLLMLLPMLRILIIVFEQVYLKESKTIFLGSIYGISILFSLFLSMMLIPKYSIKGAIYTSLITYFFLFVCLYIKQFRKVDYGYQNLLGVISFIIITWIFVFLIDLFHFHSFIKVFPLALVAGFGLFILPIFDKREKLKLLSLLKIKYVSK